MTKPTAKGMRHPQSAIAPETALLKETARSRRRRVWHRLGLPAANSHTDATVCWGDFEKIGGRRSHLSAQRGALNKTTDHHENGGGDPDHCKRRRYHEYQGADRHRRA
jgi:hypothetical protein